MTTTLLKQDQVAEMLGVSPRTLERWRLTGQGPRFVKVGGTVVRYRLDAVEAFIARDERSSTSETGAAVAA